MARAFDSNNLQRILANQFISRSTMLVSPRRAAASWATKPSAWSSIIPRSSVSFRATARPYLSRRASAKTMAWFDADPARQQIDDEANAHWDNLIEAYEHGTQEALRYFRH